VIHFDLDDRYQDENVVGSAIARRDGVMLSVIFHGFLAAALLVGPQLPIFQPTPEELARRQAELEREQDAARQRFVFVQPRLDMRSEQPRERFELSDENRQAQAPQVARVPENPLPFSRGNSSERVEAEQPERARGAEEPPQPEPEAEPARPLPPADTGFRRPPEPQPPRAAGSLGEALRNLQKYVQNETFDNPQGATDRPGATIQFDTKGVEFGPWLRRFVAQVRRNWFIPQAAMVMSGHVVLQFNIHRDGSITDLVVLQPSSIDAFNNAAYGAIVTSNPTAPLPPEYPSDRALFTVTFYYNEEPPN
jgi:TonB family protein